MYESIYKNNVDSRLLKKVTSKFFKGDGPIVIDLDLEGQSINEKGQYIVGPWAGPQAEVSNLLHEMSHFSEREIDSLKAFPISSWGFSLGKYWEIGSHSGYEPQTDQSIRREQKVWAYQLSIQRHFKMNADPYDLVSSVTWLSAWCYYQPFKKDTYKDRSRIIRLSKETEKMSRQEFTYDAFKEAWQVRIDRLQNLVKEPLLPIFRRKR